MEKQSEVLDIFMYKEYSCKYPYAAECIKPLEC